MIPSPHDMSKYFVHFLHHLPLTEEVLLLVAVAVAAIGGTALCFILFCLRVRSRDEASRLERCCCCCTRESQVREYDTLQDLLLEVEGNERGRVIQPSSSNDAEEDLEASLDTFFPNILDLGKKKGRGRRLRPGRGSSNREGEEGAAGESGDDNNESDAEEPLL
jgi:hypothetical protein